MATASLLGYALPPTKASSLRRPRAAVSTTKGRTDESQPKHQLRQRKQPQQKPQKSEHLNRHQKPQPSVGRQQGGKGFGWVLRQDSGFIWKKLEPVRRPLGVLGSRVSKVLNKVFWVRYLESDDPPQGDPPALDWPSPSYPALSGVDLLMADLEALKLYASYFHQLSKVWSTPLPEYYDPEKVAAYFNCRPHVLAVRVIEVLSSFGLAALKLQTSKNFDFGNNIEGKYDTDEVSQYYLGQVIKESMLKLGPTFIKIGQSLSTRPDIIGPAMTKALSELHENIAPFPRSEAMKIIEQELGCLVSDVFSYVSEETVAAASFGQVYKGRTLDGCSVAIKVQRPDLLHAVVRDIYLLRLGLGLVRKIAKRKSDIRLYADELGRGFVGELDYTLEAENANEFLAAHQKYSFISVPTVFRHLSRKKVLTMQWLPGENPNDLFLRAANTDGLYSSNQQIEAKKNLLNVVNNGVKASLIQLLDTGLLHADPHPGNLRYTPEGKLGFLDFGLLCRMEKKHQLAMLSSIIHIVTGDWGALVQDMEDMDVVPPRTNKLRVTTDLEQALGEVVLVDGIPDIKFSKVLGKIWSVALKYHFRMPPYYTLVLRSLASLEGLAVAADPNFKTFQAACPYVVQKLVYENSQSTRKILYSVVFNKKREFQWQRLSIFLKIGLTRKGKHEFLKSEKDVDPTVTKWARNVEFDDARFILRLLPSNDGIVVRRLLMTADPVSLARAALSRDAVVFRQQASKALADVIYKWTAKVLARINISVEGSSSMNPSVGSTEPYFMTIMRDRRLKVIFSKILRSVRTSPGLFARVCWSCLVVCVSATILALRRTVVSLSETYLMPSLSSAPKRVAMSGSR